VLGSLREILGPWLVMENRVHGTLRRREKAISRVSQQKDLGEMVVDIHGPRITDISPFAEQLMEFIKPLIDEVHAEDGSETDIEIAVREALANAVIHGNHENRDKRVHVHVTCRCSIDGEVLLTVRDDGEGFDPDALPDPTDQTNLLRTHGRGIWLMRALMDEVTFEDNGTVVCMRKILRRVPAGRIAH
jgi:serine/threonine-protein kinase RsbW